MAMQRLPGQGGPLRIKKRRKSWIERNLKWITMGITFLLFIQTFRGCLNNTSYRRSEKAIIEEKDSTIKAKNNQIRKLENLLDDSQEENQRLIYELKIAGVKADEAEKRARAIQQTAEKIKSNTTIEIKADTTRNKIN